MKISVETRRELAKASSNVVPGIIPAEKGFLDTEGFGVNDENFFIIFGKALEKAKPAKTAQRELEDPTRSLGKRIVSHPRKFED